MPKRNDKATDDLFAGPAFQRAETKPAAEKRGRIEQLEDSLEAAQKKARLWEMSYIGLHREAMRLIAMLMDLGVPAEKLGEWQKQLDHIEAIQMQHGKKRVKSVALWQASDNGNVAD